MEPHEVDGYVHRQIGMSEEQWAQHRQSLINGARSARLYYDALVAQGFTNAEAMSLLQSHGVMPKYPPIRFAPLEDGEEDDDS